MKHAHLILVFIVALLIGACGGGGGGAGTPASGGTTPTLSFSGIAAVGYPIVGGTVRFKCAAGSLPSATTGSTGAWSTAGQATPPCAAQVSGGTINGTANTTPYHSIAIVSTYFMNITPLTDLMVANMTVQDPNTWFAGLTGATLSSVTSTSDNTAITNLRTAFSGLAPLGTINPVTTTFTATPGNTSDDMLAALKAAMSTMGVSHADLLIAAATPSFSSAAVTTLNAALPAAWATTVSGSKATITGMSPTSGKAGTTVTITGTNFINARFPNPKISVYGISTVLIPDSISATEIVLRIPNDYSFYCCDTYFKLLIEQNPQDVWGPKVYTGNFNVNSSKPTISGFSPNSGAPGTVVTITGTNLSAYTAVKIGDTPAVVTGASDTSLTVTVPRGTLSGAISVTTSYGSATSSGSFTVVYLPVLMGGTIQGVPLAEPSSVTTMSITANEAKCPSYTYGTAFTSVRGITTDGANLYVTDASKNKITKINIASEQVCTLAGSGTAGNVDGIGTASSFNSPGDITTDGTNLYVVDSGNGNIRKIVIATGEVSTQSGSINIFASNATPHITTDGVNLYITDTVSRTVRQIVIASGMVSTLAGSGAAASVDGIGTAASFNKPMGITTDGTNLYVADNSCCYGNLRMIVIPTAAVRTIDPWYELPVGVYSVSDFIEPVSGITFDGFKLYEVDTKETWRITAPPNLNPSSGNYTWYTMSLAGNDRSQGQVNGIGSAATFQFPYGITSDGVRLYVADSDRIRRIAPAATITGMTRSAGVPGTVVTITGTNFKPIKIPSDSSSYRNDIWGVTVKFNGTPATITAKTDTAITVTVPNGATTGKVSVATLEGGEVTLADIFVVGAPTITGLSSSTGIAGTTVTITGTNFDIVPGNNTVMFNGTPAFVTAATATSLTTTVPVGATTGAVSVTTGGGTATATSANSFSVGAPTVTSMNRSTGIAGTSVTITGSNFDITPANNVVNIGGTQATVTTATATSLTTTIPVGATTGTVSVTTAGGTATAPNSFSVGAPTVTSMTPTTGSAGTSVTLTGTNFDVTPANNTVRFNGTQAVVTASTATSISTSVPSGISNGPVSVTTVGGTATSATSFTLPAYVKTGACNEPDLKAVSTWQCASGNTWSFGTRAVNTLTDGCALTFNYDTCGGTLNLTVFSLSASCTPSGVTSAKFAYSFSGTTLNLPGTTCR